MKPTKIPHKEYYLLIYKQKLKYMIIIDNGHGGIVNGEYVTPGKRSPVWDDETQLFEGVWNRQVAKKIHKLCKEYNIDSTLLVDSEEDISLKTRVEDVNKIYKNRKDAILISIHADAFKDEKANGFTFFTSKGETKSDEIAKTLHINYKEKIELKDRGIKEMDFYILKKTNCPAVLIECGFMTNYDDCTFLLNNVDEIANAIFLGIKEIKC